MIPPPSAKLTQVNDHFIACDQRFEDMPEQDKGRLCQACDRVLLDFTKMPVHEMIRFQADNDFKHCGNYTHQQVQAIHYHLQAEEMPKRPGMGWLVSLAIGALGLTSLNAAAQETPNPTHKIEGHTLPWYPAYMEVPGEANAIDTTKTLTQEEKQVKQDLQDKMVGFTTNHTFEAIAITEKASISIQGVVVDAERGDSLAFAKVIIWSGTKLIDTVFTNFEGKFKLDVDPDSLSANQQLLTIEVSYLGYETMKTIRPINTLETMMVELQPMNIHLGIAGGVMAMPNSKNSSLKRRVKYYLNPKRLVRKFYWKWKYGL